MKRRRGYVANSSSSSFIIAFKGEFDYDKLYNKMSTILGIPESSPIYHLVGKMADVFTWEWDEFKDIEKFKEEHYPCDEVDPKIEAAFQNYDIVYYGSLDSDTSNAAEKILCGAKLDYEDEDILVYKNETHGGYDYD